MKKIMTLKIKCYKTQTNDFEKIQDGMRPDCIIYSGPAAVDIVQYGIKIKKWHKAISKVIGKFEAEIPNDLHCIVYVKFNASYFTTTHAVGKPGEHTVFHEEIFTTSLNNFKEYIKTKEYQRVL